MKTVCKIITGLTIGLMFLLNPIPSLASGYNVSPFDLQSPAKFRMALNQLNNLNSPEYPVQFNPLILTKLHNTSELLTESIDERWETGAWLLENRDLYSYTVDDETSEILSQNWTGIAWADTEKTQFTWDINNDLVEMLSQEWQTEAWMNTYKLLISYNEHHNQTEYISQGWEDQAWKNGFRMLDEYDANQNNILFGMQNWDADSSDWIDFMQTINSFDINNLKTESLDQMWMSTFWWDTSKDFYNYDAQDNLIEEISQSWDGMSWSNASRDTYAYDANGNETEWIGQMWDGGAWQNSNRWLSSYVNDQLTEIIMQMWDGAAWVNIDRLAFSYNVDNDMQELLDQSWISEAWVNVSRTTYNYGAVGIAETKELLPKSTQLLQNYPNPFNPQTIIPFNLDQAGEIELSIYSVLGEEVEVLSFGHQPAGTYRMEWNASGYTSGVYFYVLQTDQGLRLTRKMLLLR